MNMAFTDLVKELNALAPPERRSLAPLRNPAINDVIGRLTQSFTTATEDERTQAREALTGESCEVLLGYAWEMAEEAVSLKSAEMVTRGLLALSLEDGKFDARDSIIRMAPLFRSAQKLNLGVEALFDRVASLITNPYLKSEMREFPLRSPENRDLKKAFFIQEANTSEGFRYIQQPWPMRRIIWREKLRRLFSRKT